VTPSQANKITLAENMGEVSLIPRNPDDESVVDDAQQDFEDLTLSSTANSRRREQESKSESKDEQGALAGLKSIMEQAMAASAAAAATPAPVATAPPFEMTIIYPTEVATIHFEGGRPTNPQDATQATTAATNPLLPAPAAAPADEPAAAEPAAAPAPDSATPAGFPIDFQVK
jgi:hypothetical protein